MAVNGEDGTPASYEMDQLAAALGGHEVLGGDGRSDVDVVQLTRAVLPTAVLDQLVRMVRIVLAAELTFGPEKARVWLRRPNAILRGEQPLERVNTDAGACSVTELLARIDYGLAA